jgi:hypothetical protein
MRKFYNKYSTEIKTILIIVLIGLVALVVDYLGKTIWL